jgi:hypothetical protein
MLSGAYRWITSRMFFRFIGEWVEDLSGGYLKL